MPFMLSPGVTVTEKDLTNIVPAVATSIGGFCGEFSWGPCLDPTSISNEDDLVKRFAKPNDYNAKSWFTAANYLSYSNNLICVRASPSSLRNAVAIATGSVTDIKILPGGAGSGYNPLQDEVVFSAPQVAGGTRPSATFAVNPTTGAITSFNIVSAGSGYTAAPTISVVRRPTANGSGFQGVVKLAAGSIDSITILAGGEGYDAAKDTIVIEAPTGSSPVQATASFTVDENGAIETITIVQKGAGYNSVPTVSVQTKGFVSAVTKILSGTNYDPAKDVLVIDAPASGTRAVATYTVNDNGEVLPFDSEDIIEEGSGYTVAPAIRIAAKGYVSSISPKENGGGTGYVVGDVITLSAPTGTWFNPATMTEEPGITATAEVSAVDTETGAVTAITITEEGSGYITAPTFEVESEAGVGLSCDVTIKRGSGFLGSTEIVRGSGFAGQANLDCSISAIEANAGQTGSGYDITKYVVNIGAPNSAIETGVQAEAFFEVDASGAVTGFSITNPGSGYSVAPTVDLTLVEIPGGKGFSGQTEIVTAGIKINNENEYYSSYANKASVVGQFAARYPGSMGNSIRVSIADAAVYDSWIYRNEFSAAPSTSVWALDRNGQNDEMHIVVVDKDGQWTGVKGAILERYAFVSKAKNSKRADGSNSFYKDVINNSSSYVWWMDYPEPSYGVFNWGQEADDLLFDGLKTPITLDMTGGIDSTGAAQGDLINGYAVFRDSEAIDVNLLMCGPASAMVSKYVIENIAEFRKDCLAFASPINVRNGEVITGVDAAEKIVEYRQHPSFNVNSSYGVLDSGYKYQYDRYNDTYRWIPLNGDIAGLCARTDSTNDPWWSPGGLNRGQIKNVVKLAFNPNNADRDSLYKNGINPVVSFPGQGTVLWGDKTLLAKPSAFDRINVRRLFIVLEKAVATAAKNYIFEINDHFTRDQFKAAIEPYLQDVQARRGITDFKVICDETNNTGEVIDRNEFVANIYIKPVRSINFVYLNFVAVRSAVSFDEVIGS